MEAWGFVWLKALGTFWLQPLLYYAIIFAWFIGWRRVQRERRDFHTRVYRSSRELRALIRSRSWLAIVFSIVTVGVGLVIPNDTLVFWTIVTIICSFFMQLRLLSPAYIGSIVIFTVSFFAQMEWAQPFFDRFFPHMTETNVTAIALLIGLLLFVEMWLVYREGAELSSPRLVTSKRGLVIGEQMMQRLWLVPFIIPVPGEGVTPFAAWWPMISGGDAYSFVLVPFLLGFSHRVQTNMPTHMAKWIAKRIGWLATVVSLLAIASYWWEPLAIVVAVVAILWREWIALSAKLYEQKRPPYFTKRANGLVILGVLPDTPAHKMALSVGEVIVKVNGTPVVTEDEFYAALQHNRAFCKLEVLNESGEVRFAQSALFEGEHHELGLLFVRDEG
ncbi:PDZ domain-containing protein [Anoxybacillus flavithermus]|uniref:PDZ domain-containing protein n=1 Tax=Anoxybacillus flavithermus TaxID=33934 RepID=UPI0018678D02|nr:PDZ domain-containing protein [Anoxybacillus flavithermus]MBE2912632.1 PDZ domain-containing protein [Anoxybacillus flavithermus]